MKNNIADLNNYLFESIERLMDDDLDESELQKEVTRAGAVREVAMTIIESSRLALQVKKHMDEYGCGDNVSIPLLETKQ